MAHVPLPRSISNADLDQTNRCREFIKKAWVKNAPNGSTNYFNATPAFTLTIPALTEYPKEFQEFVFKRIINYLIKEDLEASKSLNWCPGASEFVPLYTTGDGNCLLHAASLGMWGFQDRDYTLRRAVYNAVVHAKENSLHKRWREWRQVEMSQLGVELEPRQWEDEWRVVTDSVSLERSGNGSFGYLDQFHVFVLANVLRRPIILYSEPKLLSTAGGGTLQKVEFDGLYLPLLWQPEHCVKNPLPIVFSNGHFSALSIIETGRQYKDGSLLLPIVDFYGKDLPVRFSVYGESHTHVKSNYLDISEIPPPQNSYYHRRNVRCAKLSLTEQPKYFKPLLSRFIDKCLDAYQYHQSHSPSGGSSSASGDSRSCRNACGLSGHPQYDGYCYQCHKARKPHTSPEQVQENYQNQYKGGMSSSSPVLCSNQCNRLGFPEYLGMCRECYQQKQSSRLSGQLHERPPSSQRSHTTPHPSKLETRPCRTAGCDFYGNAETKYYCSKCFEERLPNIFESPDGRLSPSHTPADQGPGHQDMSAGYRDSRSRQEPPKCYNCHDFYSDPALMGLCSTCFMNKTKYEASHGNMANPLDNPPPQDRCHSPVERYSPIERQPSPITHLSRDPNHDHRDEIQPVYSNLPYVDRIAAGSEFPRRYSTPAVSSSDRDPSRGPAGVRSVATDCIICNGHVTITSSNWICRKHAEEARAMLMSRKLGQYSEEGTQMGTPYGGHAPLKQDVPPVRRSTSLNCGPSLRSELDPYGDEIPQSRDHYEVRQKVKVLCVTVGCSYQGKPEFHGLCQDCYLTYYSPGVRRAHPPQNEQPQGYSSPSPPSRRPMDVEPPRPLPRTRRQPIREEPNPYDEHTNQHNVLPYNLRSSDGQRMQNYI